MAKKTIPTSEDEIKMLRKETAHLRDYLDNLVYGLAEIDTGGKILFANTALHTILQYSSGNLAGRSILDMMPSEKEKDSLRDYLAYLAASQPEPEPWTGRYKTQDGEIIDVRIDWNYMRDSRKRVTGFSAIMMDISGQPLLQSMNETRARYQSLVENAFEGIGISRDGFFIFANRSLLEIFGYTDMEEFYRTPLIRHLLPSSGADYQNHLKEKDNTGGTRHYQYRIKRKDGQVRVVEITSSEIILKGEIYKQSTFLDVSDQIRTMESLNIYRHVVASVRDHLAFVDRDYRFLAANDAFLRTHSLTSDQVIGFTLSEVFCDTSLLANIMDYLPRAFLGEEIHSMIWYEREESQPLLLDISLYPFHENDTITGVTFSTRDVTQEIQLEMEMLNAGERERRQIGIELHDGLSHELLGLAIQAKIVGESLNDHSLNEEALSLKKIEKGINTAIGQIRTIAQGLFPPPMEKTEIRYHLDKLKAELQGTHGINCRTEFRGPVRIRDPKQAFHLSHIMQEAVLNIIRHSGARNAYIGYVADDREITLTVRDDGIGISSEISGSGMGLNIMQYRANLIGAKLEIHPASKGGTELVCTLRQHSITKEPSSNGRE